MPTQSLLPVNPASIFPNHLTLTGDCVISRPRCRLIFLNWIFIFFRKLFNRPYEFLTSYPKAYDSVRNHDPILSWNPAHKRVNWKEIQNSVLDFKTFQGMKKKWPGSKTHILTDTTIKSYFYLQLIEDKIPSLKNATVCEIGPGTGNMASLFYHHFNNKLFLVDLPRTFLFSFAFLAQSCPTAKIALP